MSDPIRSLQAAMDQTSLWLLFSLLGGSGASVMALGMLLRSEQALTGRAVLGTALHSAAWGIGVFLLVFESAGISVPFALGVSVLSGMGAASFIDLLLLIIKRRLGINVTITAKDDKA